MQFKTLANAVALALFAASAQAKIQVGLYTIAQEDPYYKPHAITFNGKGKTITVTPEKLGAKPQQWLVQDFADYNTQTISPVDYKDLQCAWGPYNEVTVLPAGDYVWNITETSYGAKTYTIQDAGNTVYWGLYSVADGTKVTLDKGTANSKWIFTPVPY